MTMNNDGFLHFGVANVKMDMLPHLVGVNIVSLTKAMNTFWTKLMIVTAFIKPGSSEIISDTIKALIKPYE
jgi:hypothetical protein